MSKRYISLQMLFALFACLWVAVPASGELKTEGRWGSAEFWSANTIEQLQDVKDCGFDYVEPMLSGSYLNREYQMDLKAKYDQVGLIAWSAHMPYGGFDFSVLDEEVRLDRVEKMKEGVKNAAEIFGIKRMVVHASNDGVPFAERAQRLAKAKESIAAIQEYADGLNMGIVICVESLPRACLGNTPEELLYMIEGTNAKICYDVNHYMGPIEYFISKAGHKIATVHFSDFGSTGDQHWLPGQGRIVWGELLHLLNEAGYDGVLMSESLKDKDNGNAKITIQQLQASYEQMCADYETMKDPEQRLKAGRIKAIQNYYFADGQTPEKVFAVGTDPGFYPEAAYLKFAAAYEDAMNATSDFDLKRQDLNTALDELLASANTVEPGYYWIQSASSYFEDKEPPVCMAMYSDNTHLLKWKQFEESLQFLFYIDKHGDGYSIYNMYDDSYMGGNAVNSQPVSMTDRAEYTQYIQPMGMLGNMALYNNLNNTYYHTLSHGSGSGTGSNIVPYSGGVRSASAWYIRKADKETTDRLLAAKVPLFVDAAKSIVDNEATLVNTVYGYPQNAMDNLKTAYAQYEASTKDVEATQALKQAYTEALSAQIMPKEGQLYRFKNFNRATYLNSAANYWGEGGCTKTADESTLWVLKAEGDGWKLKNLRRDAYMGRIHATSVPVAFNTADAGIYSISPVTEGSNVLALANINSTNAAAYSSLHTQGTNLLAWTATSPSSQWYMQVVDEATELENLYVDLAQRICTSGAQDGWPGTYLPEDVKALREAYQAFLGSDNADTRKEMAEQCRLLTTTKERCGIVPGQYYRLVSKERKSGDKRLAMTVDQDLIGVAGSIEDGENNTVDVNMIWSFTSNDKGKVCMHTANGVYLKSLAAEATEISGAVNANEAGLFMVGFSEQGAWTLRSCVDSKTMGVLHANGSGKIIAYADMYSLWYIEPVDQIMIPLHASANDDASFSSAYLPFDVTSVSGAAMYTGEVADEVITLQEQTAVKACTPVILKGELNAEAAQVTIAQPSDEVADTNSGLSGTLLHMAVEPSSVLTLGVGKESGRAGFYRFSGTTVGPNRVYVALASGNANALAFAFENGGTTAIEGITEDASAQDAPVYDLTGRRVSKMQKGQLYIRNDRKFIAQ